MKESTLATKIMIAVVCVAVICYMAVYLILGLREDLMTTTAYEYSVDVGTEATGILVRRETPITEGGAYVDVLLEEGEKVAAGGEIAVIHTNPASMETRQEIQVLEAEISQLQHALSVGTQGVNSSKLDQQVISSIVAIRGLAASGDLSTLEDSALNLRTMVFQRDYVYGDTDAATQISQLIQSKQQELANLNSSLGLASQTVTASASGVFSGEVDGYESLITPDMLDTLTPQALGERLEAEAPAAPQALGKLITGSTWYMAALFQGEEISGLAEGRSYTVSFSQDYYGTVKMTLERVEIGDGVTMAVFSANSHMADTTLLRIQTVDVITQSLEGIRIPRRALRVETETVTDENGNQSQVNTYGVYTVVGTQAEWQTVNVIYTDEDFYLVEPTNSEASSRLRAGDQVILNTKDIFDGKVVR